MIENILPATVCLPCAQKNEQKNNLFPLFVSQVLNHVNLMLAKVLGGFEQHQPTLTAMIIYRKCQ